MLIKSLQKKIWRKHRFGAKEYIAKNGHQKYQQKLIYQRKKWTLVLALMALGFWGVEPRNRELNTFALKILEKYYIDVILKTSYCKVCKNLKHKMEIGTISLVQYEYIGSYNEHKLDCLLNQEGSALVSENLYTLPLYWNTFGVARTPAKN